MPASMEAVQARPPNPLGVGSQGEPTTTDFVECYLAHYRRLVRALELAGADRALAEDVTQEAFARALPRWRRISRGSNPPGYVYRAGFRLLERALKKAARTRTGALPELAAPGVDAEVASAVVLEQALAAMPLKRRACAVMCLVVGLAVHEAGEALGIADGTVRKHLDEARRELRAACGEPPG